MALRYPNLDNTKDAFLALVGDGKTHRETRETKTLTCFDGISFGDCPQHLLLTVMMTQSLVHHIQQL